MGESGYRAFFHTQHVPQLALSMVLARLPVGVVTIVLVLFVSTRYGATVAGLCTAGFTIGMACLAPVFGKFVDKGYGPVTLRVLAVVEMISVLALVALVLAQTHFVLAIAASFCCGAFMPPIAGVTRSLWPSMLDMSMIATAYNFEVLVIDVLYVTGPLLASIFVAIGAPEAGLISTTAASLVGTFILASLEPVKNHAQRNRTRRAQATQSADASAVPAKVPLLTFAVMLLLLAALMRLMFSGWLETIIPLFYNDMGQAALGSIAISAWSVGSVLGVVLFHRFQPNPRTIAPVKQMALFTGIFMAVSILAGFGVNGFAIMCVLMVLVGASGAPVDNLHYQLASTLSPQERQAEMFSWLNTASNVGIAGGAFFAGLCADYVDYGIAFFLPSICLVLSFAFTAVLMVSQSGRRPKMIRRRKASQA
ncbi:MFS transporter [uncultured Slackia sp.]|jgi:MFS family permease|uniref:MFS transporter n=1 Tax=uncultured Slackia sp. TaxID=665903 RepID=UPI0025F7F93C|nr:MFS transporter [uncultured Slackia sp.]